MRYFAYLVCEVLYLCDARTSLIDRRRALDAGNFWIRRFDFGALAEDVYQARVGVEALLVGWGERVPLVFVAGAHVHRSHISEVVDELLLAGPVEEAFNARGTYTFGRQKLVCIDDIVFFHGCSVVPIYDGAIFNKRRRGVNLIELPVVESFDYHDVLLVCV